MFIKPSLRTVGSIVIAIPLFFRVLSAFFGRWDPTINFMTEPVVVLSFFVFGGFLFIFNFIVKPVLFAFLMFFVLIIALAITLGVYV